jgi:hypothetical protein
MDSTVPEDMDGKVLTSMFEEEVLRLKPCQRGEALPGIVRREVATEYDEAEKAAISERLRQLGYLE